jgi:hypothetical protein
LRLGCVPNIPQILKPPILCQTVYFLCYSPSKMLTPSTPPKGIWIGPVYSLIKFDFQFCPYYFQMLSLSSKVMRR